MDGSPSGSMDKKSLTEADIRTKFITPATGGESGAGLDVMIQLLEGHYLIKARVIVQMSLGISLSFHKLRRFPEDKALSNA